MPQTPSDNTQLNQGAYGDIIRDINRNGVKTQVIILDGGDATTEKLITSGQKTMADSMPVTLSSNQSTIPAHVIGFEDSRGTAQYLAPNGEQVSLPLYKLVGDTFSLASLDAGMWASSLGVGGSAAVTGGELVISTGVTANNSVIVNSVAVARFTGIGPNKLRTLVQLPDTGTANNTRKWGVDSPPTHNNGAYYVLTGSIFSLVTRKAGTDTTIANGTFNGQFGSTFSVDTLAHNYEIIYQPRQVVFVVDGRVLHTLSASATPWSDTLHLHAHFENTNSGGSISNVSLKVRLGAIARFGIPEAQPESVNQIGIGSQTLKIGPGNLHRLVISAVVNNAVITIYDNTAASGTIIFTSGAMPANAIPLSIDMGGLAFDVGLTVAVTASAANALVIYD